MILVSTEYGQRLYRSVEFATVSFIHKLVSDHPILLPSDLAHNDGMESMIRADLDEVVQLDAVVIGASRQAFLRSRFPFLDSGVVFRNFDGVIQGYAMTVCRNHLLIVGPVVAPSLEISTGMVQYLIEEWRGRIRIDVPSAQKEFFDKLIVLGFKETERLPVMMRNATELPGDRNRHFAIAAQAFG